MILTKVYIILVILWISSANALLLLLGWTSIFLDTESEVPGNHGISGLLALGPCLLL